MIAAYIHRVYVFLDELRQNCSTYTIWTDVLNQCVFVVVTLTQTQSCIFPLGSCFALLSLCVFNIIAVELDTFAEKERKETRKPVMIEETPWKKLIYSVSDCVYVWGVYNMHPEEITIHQKNACNILVYLTLSISLSLFLSFFLFPQHIFLCASFAVSHCVEWLWNSHNVCTYDDVSFHIHIHSHWMNDFRKESAGESDFNIKITHRSKHLYMPLLTHTLVHSNPTCTVGRCAVSQHQAIFQMDIESHTHTRVFRRCASLSEVVSIVLLNTSNSSYVAWKCQKKKPQNNNSNEPN